MNLNLRMTMVSSSLFFLCLAVSAYAVLNEDNQGRWEKPCEAGPDADVPGFLVNMGPTGARGILTRNSFIVKYVFSGSPAFGRLQVGDEVTGANGKLFAQHTFGGSSETGIKGPIQDLGLAIEDSEGADGILTLTVKRGLAVSSVKVPLEKLGRFADTFPVNCKKTDVLKKRAYKYLLDNSDGLNSQGRCVTILAMLSSDDPQVFAEGKKRAKEWTDQPDDKTWTWHLGFQGITLAEYYLLTKDKSVLAPLEGVLACLRNAQYKGPNIQVWKPHGGADQATMDIHQALYEGGFGHAPFNGDGMAEADSPRLNNGYGPMQRPTYLAIMAWQLSKMCGIKVEHDGIEKAFQFVDYGTRVSGNTAYGGEFTLNNGPIDWEEWKKGSEHGNSHKSGMAYLLYMLSPERPESKARMALHLKNIDAAYMDMPDGHACPMMGLVWGWAGVYASTDTALKKKITEYYKAWINMARCHGSDSYVILPGRNYADGSYHSGNIRNHTTGSIAFLYSYSTPRLKVQGGPVAVKPDSGSAAAKAAPTPAPAARKARSMSKENRAVLDKSLLGTLSKLSESGELKEMPLFISPTKARVWLKSAASDGTLTFAQVGGSKTVDFKWGQLAESDHTTLAILVSALKPDSNDAQAMAAVYMESIGRVGEADKYFEKAGSEAREKLEKLFEAAPTD